MDWLTVGEEIVKLGLPILGAAVSGGTSAILPAILGEVFNAASLQPDDISKAMEADANAAEKLKEIEVQHAAHIASIPCPACQQPLLSSQTSRSSTCRTSIPDNECS